MRQGDLSRCLDPGEAFVTRSWRCTVRTELRFVSARSVSIYLAFFLFFRNLCFNSSVPGAVRCWIYVAGRVRALLSCHRPTPVQPLSRHPRPVLWVGLPAPPAPQPSRSLPCSHPGLSGYTIVAYLPSLHLWSKNSDHVILILWCWSGFALWLGTGQFLWMFPVCLEWGLFFRGTEFCVWWFQIILNSITYMSWGHISCCSQSRMFWRIFFSIIIT